MKKPRRASVFQQALTLAKETWRIFDGTRAPARGAAIAFYAVTAVVPILVLVIAVAGFVLGREAASGALFGQFTILLGQEGADLLEKAVASAADKEESVLATAVSFVTVLLTASGVFLELEHAFNAIWDAKVEDNLAYTARARLISIGLVIALGFLLVVSLAFDAALAAAGNVLEASLPIGKVLMFVISSAFSFVALTAVLAAIMNSCRLPSLPGGMWWAGRPSPRCCSRSAKC